MVPEPDEITWEWEGKRVDLGLDRRGQGPPILLLPALSSISTRRELRSPRGLAQSLRPGMRRPMP